LAPEAGFEPA